MTTLPVSENAFTTSATTIVIGPNVFAGALPDGVSRHVAPVFAGRQAYYWTSEWQKAEVEALAALAAGESRSFEDPIEALVWLLNEDDD